MKARLKRSHIARVVLSLAMLLVPQTLLSHSAVIEAETALAIQLRAVFDTGAPMSHAQVIIHAPDTPETPWGQGVTDREGRFDFIPDAIDGRWTVQVRQAGHGAITHVQMSGGRPEMMTAQAPADWLQRALMVALVAWGALGTALFALRKGRPNASA